LWSGSSLKMLGTNRCPQPSTAQHPQHPWGHEPLPFRDRPVTSGMSQLWKGPSILAPSHPLQSPSPRAAHGAASSGRERPAWFVCRAAPQTCSPSRAEFVRSQPSSASLCRWGTDQRGSEGWDESSWKHGDR